MEIIKLSENNILENAGHSSKGNQPKWFYDGIYYKADHMGYEGLAEVVVSELLAKANIKNYVKYYPIKIEFGNNKRSGCYSYNFRNKDEELIPLERLHRSFEGIGLSQRLSEFDNPKDKIEYTVGFVEKVTGLKDFGKYLTAMLEIDALFLNEDRHTNNIAVIRNSKTNKFSLCPYFDQGLSLLSDLEGFWLDGDTEKHILRVSAKPFGTFKSQVLAAEELYGKQLKIKFGINDVDTVLEALKEYYNEDIIKRVRFVMEKQIDKYKS